MAFQLGGKVAIVTGGGTRLPGIGIGCGVARVLARQGASILVVDREEDNAKATVGLIEEEGGRAAVCVADVSSESDCQSMVHTALASLGGLDILVGNAGISLHASITETTPICTRTVMAVNLRGTFMACKYGPPGADRPRWGIAGQHRISRGYQGCGSYASRVRCFQGRRPGPDRGPGRRITGRRNVRVNAVSAGDDCHPIQASIGTPSPEIQKRMNMLGRMGDVWDIAHTVGFLCSDEASYITGQVISVCGGATQGMPASSGRR